MSTYPRASVVILGEEPATGGPHPLFGASPSSSSRRMDSLVPGWRERAVGANLWWCAGDRVNGVSHHLKQIVEETQCVRIVALGAFVQRALDLNPKHAVLFGWEFVDLAPWQITAVRFPHPSGRNRYWNTEARCREAAATLREVLG